MPFLILSVIIQVAVIVHIIKTGRNLTWVFIVLFFPLIGMIVYFIVEILPGLLGSRTARGVGSSVRKKINPNRDLNNATQNFAVADTVQNAMDLANECLAKDRFSEAKDLFTRSLRGVHADDPDLLLGLAKAQFGLEELQECIATLDTLKQNNPDYKSADGHLLYARAKQGLGDKAAAIHEYEALCQYYSGPEPACRLALIYKTDGDTRRANDLFQKVLNDSKISGRHYNSLHKEWVSLARRELE